MSIAIQPSKTSRIQALAEARPNLTPKQIATELGLLTSEVRGGLARQGRRRIKSVAR
jgi:hypothetical protein